MFFILYIFYILILTTCSVGIHNIEKNCQIDKQDRLEMFYDTYESYLFKLSISPNNQDIVLPKPYLDYYIPSLYIVLNKQNVDNNVNISPPILIHDVCNKSCLINISKDS